MLLFNFLKCYTTISTFYHFRIRQAQKRLERLWNITWRIFCNRKDGFRIQTTCSSSYGLLCSVLSSYPRLYAAWWDVYIHLKKNVFMDGWGKGKTYEVLSVHLASRCLHVFQEGAYQSIKQTLIFTNLYIWGWNV